MYFFSLCLCIVFSRRLLIRLPDYTRGIFQSIGFKEFHEYLMLSEENRKNTMGQQLFTSGVSAMKLATRRYARKQIKWIQNRFLRRPDRQVPPVYALDSTNVGDWDEVVMKPAFQVVESYMNSTPCDISSLPVEKGPTANIHNSSELVGEFFCDVCERVFIGSLQWQIHVKSKKHQRVLRRKEREKKQSETFSEHFNKIEEEVS